MHLLHKTIVIRRAGELTLGKRYDGTPLDQTFGKNPTVVMR